MLKESKLSAAVLTIFVLGVILFVGIYLYNVPSEVVNHYISDFTADKNNQTIYPQNIYHFLNFHQSNNFPAPSVGIKTINHSINSREILASFEIITYDSIGRVKHVYSGKLLFYLVRNKLEWKINSIDIIDEYR